MKDSVINKDIWIIGEMNDGRPHNVTFEILEKGRGLAAQMKAGLHVILSGRSCGKAAQYLAHRGADEVVVIEDGKLSEGNPFIHAKAIVQCLRKEKPWAVFVGATAFGRGLAAAVAAKLGTELIADAADIIYDSAIERLVVTKTAADRTSMADFIISGSSLQMITVRSGMMKQGIENSERTAKIRRAVPIWHEDIQDMVIYGGISAKNRCQISLGSAEIIVSGGRGLKTKENFEMLYDLAKRLNGQVGATRPCIDAGWAPYERQVGQSGTAVKPKLYIAFGISGAIQHMTAIGAKYMVAVNQDPEAAIFKYCDYGIIGDAAKVLRAMIDQLDSMNQRHL